MTDDDPWKYAYPEIGFATRREFLEYLRARAIEADAHQLLHGIDKMMQELDEEERLFRHKGDKE